MRLLHRQGSTTGETPEQTLARLNAAGPNAHDPVPNQPPEPRFTVAHKWGRGYNISEVNAFIDAIDQRTADEIRQVVFSPQGRWNRGYEEDEVDRFLDEQIAQLDKAADASKSMHPTATKPATASDEPRRPWFKVRYIIWALGGVVLYLLLLLVEDMSRVEAAVSWVLAVAILGLVRFGGGDGGGGDGGGWFDGDWFDGGGFDGG